MESYDVIANQPVVIDNVSAGGRASRERGGPAIPLSSGRPRPARRHPPTSAGSAAASGPLTAPYGVLGGRGRCASASHDWLGQLAITRSGAAAPRWGAQPPPPPSCHWLGGAARPHWLRQLSVSGTARCYLPERGGTVARAPALIGSSRCQSGGASPVRPTPLCAGGTMGVPGQAMATLPACCGAGLGQGSSVLLAGRECTRGKLWGCWRFPGPMQDMELSSQAPLTGPARQKP